MPIWPCPPCQTQPPEDGTSAGLFQSSCRCSGNRVSKEPRGGWHTGTVPLCQLAHLRYALTAALPMHDGANRLPMPGDPRQYPWRLLLPPRPWQGPAWVEHTAIQGELSDTPAGTNHHEATPGGEVKNACRSAAAAAALRLLTRQGGKEEERERDGERRDKWVWSQ